MRLPLLCLLLALAGTAAASPRALLLQRRPPDRVIITDLVKLHVYRRTGIRQNRLRVTVEKLQGGYARARVTTSDRSLDPAKVYLRKSDFGWEVLAGPGTSFSARELRRLGVPPGVR